MTSGPWFRNIDVFDLLPLSIENGDAFAGQVNVTFGFGCHSVGAQRAVIGDFQFIP